jgi:hypothetical protein
MRRSLRHWAQISDVLAECRRADEELSLLRRNGLGNAVALLSDKEARHLTHTVFRVNGLLYLYSLLRGERHDTRLGVVLGAITHLLDHVFDHHADSLDAAKPFEELVNLRRKPKDDCALEQSLHTLAEEAWQRVADQALLKRRLKAMLETQRETMAQENGTQLSPEFLERITAEKGHRSLCLYFAAVNARFDGHEERALRRFGFYMQYMDDLEDYYEDRHEARQSPIPNPWRGALRATRLLRDACPDLRVCYEPRCPRPYRTVMAWVRIFHATILLSCVTREVTRRLPARPQTWADRFAERLTECHPFFHAAPVGSSYLRLSPPRATGVARDLDSRRPRGA